MYYNNTDLNIYIHKYVIVAITIQSQSFVLVSAR